tara:strand:- start:16677 stop:18770 length:2094 start_codon:yes stop_codon:yes gene_type:complete
MIYNQTLNSKTPVQYIKGIGPKRALVLNKIGIETAIDLLYFFPRRHLDRTSITPIKKIIRGKKVTIVATVEASGLVQARRRKYFQLIVNDGSAFLKCIWFNNPKYVENLFSIGNKVAFHGKVEFYNGYQLIHPEYDILSDAESEPLNTGGVIPIYSSNEELKKIGLDSRGFRRIIKYCLDNFDFDNEEFLSDRIIENYKLISLERALKFIHFSQEIDQLSKAKHRLKFDEHFFLQLLIALRKLINSKRHGKVIPNNGAYVKRIFNSISFDLTGAQKKALSEIHSDMASRKVMNRLVQGDVGSGKTIVAILASAIVAGNNFQVAVMVPTEILAYQHYSVFKSYFDKVRVPVGLLVGKQNLSERKNLLSGIEDGKIRIVIGTHAIIQKEIKFQDLGLIIIDEQQRFGVIQRGNLVDKGLDPHVLSMTATPIPRTLANTFYGDMDLSLINEMPKHRKPVTTKVVNQKSLEKVYGFMESELEKGRQCIVIYPLIDDSEKLDLETAINGFEVLKRRFLDYSVELVHGRMKREEKDKIMSNFSTNKIKLLVSTTVIEVGIDVPNATVMLIENAERFGLTQLHQLRGRIGRGSEKGYCILIHRKITENSKKRLSIMERTKDGFEISDEDLKLRGPGEFYGTRQHGYPIWKIADIVNDGTIIRDAQKAASNIIDDDNNLIKISNEKIRKRFFQEYQGMLNMVNIT